MKKIILVLTGLILIYQNSYSQQWQEVNNTFGFSQLISDVKFVNANTGYAVLQGDGSNPIRVLKTLDKGSSWTWVCTVTLFSSGSAGGVVKSIYEIESNFKVKINNKWQPVTREELIKLCEEFESQGEQIKLAHTVPQILAVFDEKTVFFSLYDESIPKKERSDVIIKNKRFAKFITELFNIYWERSDTIEAFKKLFLNNNNK